MLVVKTLEQDEGSGSMITGLTIGECLFAVSKKEWESFAEFITEDSEAYLSGSDSSVSINLHELYKNAIIIKEANESIVEFVSKYGCDEALNHFREYATKTKRTSTCQEKFDAMILFHRYIYSKYPEQTEIMVQADDESHSIQYYGLLHDSAIFRQFNANYSEILSNYYSNDRDRLRFIKDIDEVWCRLTIGPNAFKIRFKYIIKSEPDPTTSVPAILGSFGTVMAVAQPFPFAQEVREKTIVSVEVFDNPRYTPRLVALDRWGFIERVSNKDFDLEEFFFYSDYTTIYTNAKPEGMALRLNKFLESSPTKENKASFYILQNQCSDSLNEVPEQSAVPRPLEKEGEKFSYQNLEGDDRKTFQAICKSFKIIVEEEYGAENDDDVFCFSEWCDLKGLDESHIDPDWGSCLNPEIIPKLIEKGVENAVVLVFMYIKDH